MGKGTYRKRSIRKGTGFPLGACILDDKHVQFSISLPNVKYCDLYLFLGQEEKETFKIELEAKDKIGSIFSVIVAVEWKKGCEYLYETAGDFIVDPYAKLVTGRCSFGMPIDLDIDMESEPSEQSVRGVVVKQDLFLEENRPRHAYNDSILYRMHVRGYTMDPSSKVDGRGTFRGIIEKIPYIKELGITAVELMPCYEFDEIEVTSPYGRNYYSSSVTRPLPKDYLAFDKNSWKLNYWGYTSKANYLSPKLSYCYDKDNPCGEMRDMVKAFHDNGIEVIMEMYFGDNANQTLILDCLHYWVTEYHIDGFKLNKDWIPMKMIATDPYLSQTKLFTADWDVSYIFPDGFMAEEKCLADCQDDFMNVARKFLKGDEEMAGAFSECLKRNSKEKANVNYIANTNGFTLKDMVSYDVKHNEANGENGMDGTDYNYSWNCGVEGKTRRKTVLNLRRKQLKNAMLMLFLSQGTPMILAGDEFLNSQEGNNNAYCQDNPVSWVNWKEMESEEWFLSFMRKLIAFRKQHKVLHKSEPLRNTDFISCGCPDISFHSSRAWYPNFSNYSRELGVLYCGKYAKVCRTQCDSDIYIMFNFHWESHKFDLPNPPGGGKWRVVIDTAAECENELAGDLEEVDEKSYLVKARSVVVFTA